MAPPACTSLTRCFFLVSLWLAAPVAQEVARLKLELAKANERASSATEVAEESRGEVAQLQSSVQTLTTEVTELRLRAEHSTSTTQLTVRWCCVGARPC